MGVLWGMGYCTFKNMKLKLPPVSALVCRQFLRGVWLQSSSTILVDFYLTLRIYRWKEETLHPGVPMSQEQEEKWPQRGSWEKPEKQEHRSPANPLQIQSFRLSEGFSLSLSLGRGWVQGEQEGEGSLREGKGLKSYANSTPKHWQCSWSCIQRLDISVISIVGERIIQHRNIFN